MYVHTEYSKSSPIICSLWPDGQLHMDVYIQILLLLIEVRKSPNGFRIQSTAAMRDAR